MKKGEKRNRERGKCSEEGEKGRGRERERKGVREIQRGRKREGGMV